MKLGWFILMVLMVSCQWDQSDDDLSCFNIAPQAETVHYEKAVSGMSCQFLEELREYDYGSSCSIALAGPQTMETTDSSTEENVENYLVPGVSEGATTAFSSTKQLAIEDGYLVLRDKTNPSSKKILSFDSPRKLFSWQEYFVVQSYGKLSVLDETGTTVHEFDFNGWIKTYLKQDKLTIVERIYDPDDEATCERIHYYSDRKWGSLFKIHSIALASFELSENEEIHYGSWQSHMDRSSLYLVDTSWDGSGLLRLRDNEYKLLNDRVSRKEYMREYGDELHLVSSPTVGGAKYVVLDEELEVKNELEVVASDERVKAAHFTENMVYFATFRNVDPLFLVDPMNPEYLSELKYPGDPLHLQEVGDYLISINRVSFGAHINLVNIDDARSTYIQDYLKLDNSLWGFNYLNFLKQDNYIYVHNATKSYLVKVSDRLELIEEFGSVSSYYFLNDKLFVFDWNGWREVALD